MSLVWSPDYAPVDGDFADVSLLLLGEGTNGSTTILDSSSNNFSVSANGDAQISTAVNTPFGTGDGVLAFDGTGDYLTTAVSNKNNFGAVDFSIEFWIKSTKTGRVDPFGWNYPFSAAGWAGFICNLSGPGSISWYENANSRITALSTGWNNGSWNHIALTQNVNNLRLFVNGNQVGSYTTSFSYGANNSGFIIGDISSGGGPLDGYISNLRITKGVARYTENFDVPTAPFPILSPSTRIEVGDGFDVEAANYILAVEAADAAAGQSGGLEPAVRTAINDFVVGCKSDGIWNAIKESCLLSGARTVEGALVPLKGSAPTNNGPFTAADYDRKTGLVGDGSSKYLETAALVSSLAGEDSHVSINCSAFGNKSFLGNVNIARFDWFDVTGVPTIRHLYGGGGGGQLATSINTLGFIGTVRTSLSTTYVVRANGTNYNVTAGAPGLGANEPLWILRSASRGYSTDRIAFYSIGESLDLALLDTRISDFITAIGDAIP
jgi:hypothetical protein